MPVLNYYQDLGKLAKVCPATAQGYLSYRYSFHARWTARVPSKRYTSLPVKLFSTHFPASICQTSELDLDICDSVPWKVPYIQDINAKRKLQNPHCFQAKQLNKQPGRPSRCAIWLHRSTGGVHLRQDRPRKYALGEKATTSEWKDLLEPTPILRSAHILQLLGH